MNMTVMRLIKIAMTSAIMLSATIVSAAQNLRTDADEQVGFNVSTTGVTRVSIVGDRIRRIVNDSEFFEMSNDEATGDIFFRALGETTRSETGYIVTERGTTIGYTMQPIERGVGSVLITITGQEQAADEEAVDFGGGFGFSDDVASMTTDIVRDVALEHVMGRDVPSGRDGRTIRRVNGDGWKASVRIAVAGDSGRLVREQDFYAVSVRAVWIANPNLPANGRTFVVIVEAD
jgi:hypothetical protein